MEGQARQTGAEGPQCTLDGEVVKGEAGRRWSTARRLGGACLRLQESHRHRPTAWADPDLGRDRRRPSRWGATGELDLKGEHGSEVWADTAYRSQANEKCLASNHLVSRIHRKKPKGKPMPVNVARANAAKSKVRAAVEHIFARQKGPMGLFVRTIGIARATVKIGLANITYNMKRAVWLTEMAAVT